MKKIFLAAIALVLVFSACKKDDEVKLSNFEMLTAHKWKYSSIIQTIGTVSEDQLTGSCKVDDIMEFKPSYEMHFNNGTEFCSASQEQTGTEPYTMSDNQDTIYPYKADPLFIKSISLDKMEWEVKWVEDQKEVVTVLTLVEP